MQQRTVVCSAVINQKITDFSNDFFFKQMDRKRGVFLCIDGLFAFLL